MTDYAVTHYVYNEKTGSYAGCYDKRCPGDDSCPVSNMNISSSNNLPVGLPYPCSTDKIRQSIKGSSCTSSSSSSNGNNIADKINRIKTPENPIENAKLCIDELVGLLKQHNYLAITENYDLKTLEIFNRVEFCADPELPLKDDDSTSESDFTVLKSCLNIFDIMRIRTKNLQNPKILLAFAKGHACDPVVKLLKEYKNSVLELSSDDKCNICSGSFRIQLFSNVLKGSLSGIYEIKRVLNKYDFGISFSQLCSYVDPATNINAIKLAIIYKQDIKFIESLLQIKEIKELLFLRENEECAESIEESVYFYALYSDMIPVTIGLTGKGDLNNDYYAKLLLTLIQIYVPDNFIKMYFDKKIHNRSTMSGEIYKQIEYHLATKDIMPYLEHCEVPHDIARLHCTYLKSLLLLYNNENTVDTKESDDYEYTEITRIDSNSESDEFSDTDCFSASDSYYSSDPSNSSDESSEESDESDESADTIETTLTEKEIGYYRIKETEVGKYVSTNCSDRWVFPANKVKIDPKKNYKISGYIRRNPIKDYDEHNRHIKMCLVSVYQYDIDDNKISVGTNDERYYHCQSMDILPESQVIKLGWIMGPNGVRNASNADTMEVGLKVNYGKYSNFHDDEYELWGWSIVEIN